MKTILVDAYNTFVTDSGINKDMFDILEAFPNDKVILTNADTEKQKELGIVNMPYPVFAGNFDPMKNDPKYFELFFQNFSLTSSDVIYFEHNIDAYNTATKMGITCYHYDYKKKDMITLKEFITQNI